MAAQVGLQYQLPKAIVANTKKAHRLSHLAKQFGLQDAIEEALFKAHFVDEKDIDDDKTLIQIANLVGIENEAVLTLLNSNQFADNVQQDIQEAEQIGVQGVPFFVFDRKYAISGAQDVSIFANTLQKSFGEWKAQNLPTNIEYTEGATCKPDGQCN